MINYFIAFFVGCLLGVAIFYMFKCKFTTCVTSGEQIDFNQETETVSQIQNDKETIKLTGSTSMFAHTISADVDIRGSQILVNSIRCTHQSNFFGITNHCPAEDLIQHAGIKNENVPVLASLDKTKTSEGYKVLGENIEKIKKSITTGDGSNLVRDLYVAKTGDRSYVLQANIKITGIPIPGFHTFEGVVSVDMKQAA